MTPSPNDELNMTDDELPKSESRSKKEILNAALDAQDADPNLKYYSSGSFRERQIEDRHEHKEHHRRHKHEHHHEQQQQHHHHHHHHHHRHHLSRKKRTLFIIIAVFLILTLTVASLIFVGRYRMLNYGNTVIDLPENDNVYYENDGKTVTYNGKIYLFNENITSILCMGIDRENLSGSSGFGTNGQADAIFLLAIDTKSGEVNAIAVNRDTMVDVDRYTTKGEFAGTKTEQLCLSYSYGDGYEKSCENVIKSVSELFYGIPVKSYLAIDLEAIGVLNDAIGGISVVSPETFSVQGIDFYEGKTAELNTYEKAKYFVKYRDISNLDSNLKRMKRQKLYLSEFSKAAIKKTKQNITFPVFLYNAIDDYKVSNLTVDKLSFLTTTVIAGREHIGVNFLSIDGTIQQGEVYAEFVPDEKSLFETVLKVFYTEKELEQN